MICPSDVAIGDTFQRDDRPGIAWEVVDEIAPTLVRVRAGDDAMMVRTHWLSQSHGWNRCDAYAVVTAHAPRVRVNVDRRI